MYFKLNTEAMGVRLVEYLSATDFLTDVLEIRLSPTLGKNFSDRNRLELGIEYRLQFKRYQQRQGFWMSLNWFFSNK